MAENKNNEVFPISETSGEVKKKNISPTPLPHFHGLTSKDPNTFMFEFDVVYMTLDYDFIGQKLKLFPSTLNDVALCCFMVFLGITSLPKLKCNKPLTKSTWTTVGVNKPKNKYLE